jgi:hypothetical protein
MADATVETEAGSETRKTFYTPFGLALSQAQKDDLVKAVQERSVGILELGAGQLEGEDILYLTKTQIAAITKNKSDGRGANIRLSRAQLKAMTKMECILNGVAPVRPTAQAVCEPKMAKFKRYVEYTTTLTQSQIDTLVAASGEKTEASIVLSIDQLRGKHTLSLTKQQVCNLMRNKNAGLDVEVKFSRNQIKKMMESGGIVDVETPDVGAMKIE